MLTNICLVKVLMPINVSAHMNNLLITLDTLLFNFEKYIVIMQWKGIQNYILAELRAANIVWKPFTLNMWFNMFIDYTLAVVLVGMTAIYILVVGAKIIGNITSGRDNYLALYSHFEDWEEELGSLDDSLYYILFMGLVIVWFYFFMLFSSYLLAKNISWLVSIFTLILLSGIIVPGSVLKHMGMYFSHYVRGSGRTTNVLFEIMLDVVSVSIIMIRFFIQNIRFIFIFFAFFELYEFIYFKLDILFSVYINSATVTVHNLLQNNYSSWSYVEVILQIWMQWFTYLYYLGHLTLLFIVQLSIYFILSFWLFFFLYTSFFLQPKEKYFFYKRNMSL